MSETGTPLESLVVPAALAGERVDRAVALLTGWSRAEVQVLIDAGSVLVDGKSVIKSRRLVEGDVVDLLAEPEPVGVPQAQDIPIVVVHEDADVIVVDKPAGLIVHPGAGHPDGTLVNGLLQRFPELAGVGDPYRPGIVHRLDGNTSGLLAVARTPAAYDALVDALAARTVERGYLALVWGVPDAASGLIDAPIGRSIRRPTRMAVRDGGRQARTRYSVERTLHRSRGQPVALLPRDRSDASDPRAPRRDPASGRRRSGVRRDSCRARDFPPVSACRDVGIRASGDRRAATLRVGAPSGAATGTRPGRVLTTRSTVRFTTSSVEKMANQRTGVLPESVPAVRAWTVATAKSPKLLRWIACHTRRGIRRWSSEVTSMAMSR